MVRLALRKVAREGLPGEHHFFIAFATTHPGVVISERLKTRYPEEMTIVLQHQFWNLVVRERDFEADLSFDNIPERLVVPLLPSRAFSTRMCSSACSSSRAEEEGETPRAPASEAVVAPRPARLRRRLPPTMIPKSCRSTPSARNDPFPPYCLDLAALTVGFPHPCHGRRRCA